MQSNIDDSFAYVFVANKGVNGAFSLVLENGWKLMLSSLSLTFYNFRNEVNLS